MKRIVIALLLSIFGPGLGQIYNREVRKGLALLIVSTALLLLPAIWLIVRVQPLLPKTEGQPTISQEAVQAAAIQIVQKDKLVLNAISFSFLGLWAYAITQSYFKAQEINEQEAEKNPDSDDRDPPGFA